VRWPAEWERQDGVLLAWPHEGTDWAPRLGEVEGVYAQIAAAISRRERVLIVRPGDAGPVLEGLRAGGADLSHIQFYDIPTNDTWTRDFGPIGVLEKGQPVLLDFMFNGWGLKFAADLDNLVTWKLAEQRAFGKMPLRAPGMVLEGGSVDGDGAGTVLTTEACLLSRNRNPHLTRAKIERKLGRWLGADRILWLRHGALAGDDTDSHVDTLARFCPSDTIVHVACADRRDEQYEELDLMRRELAALRTRRGRKYRLLPLPLPGAIRDEEGRRLPATYANFLVINGAVMAPQYGDAADKVARATLKAAFPGREIIGMDCTPLLFEHGSLHCVTMQIPEGTLS